MLSFFSGYFALIMHVLLWQDRFLYGNLKKGWMFMTFKQALEEVKHEERPLASKVIIAIGNIATAPIVVPTSLVTGFLSGIIRSIDRRKKKRNED